jgi:hypothetical protein
MCGRPAGLPACLACAYACVRARACCVCLVRLRDFLFSAVSVKIAELSRLNQHLKKMIVNARVTVINYRRLFRYVVVYQYVKVTRAHMHATPNAHGAWRIAYPL